MPEPEACSGVTTEPGWELGCDQLNRTVNSDEVSVGQFSLKKISQRLCSQLDLLADLLTDGQRVF